MSVQLFDIALLYGQVLCYYVAMLYLGLLYSKNVPSFDESFADFPIHLRSSKLQKYSLAIITTELGTCSISTQQF